MILKSKFFLNLSTTTSLTHIVARNSIIIGQFDHKMGILRAIADHGFAPAIIIGPVGG